MSVAPSHPSGLGRTHAADARVVALIMDLRGNVADAGLPAHAHSEIGQFIEILAEAFGAAVGADGPVNVNAWHTHLPGAHAATYGPLFTAYGHRNLASHANAERVLLNAETVAVDLAAVERLLPVVTAELDRKRGADFLGHVERHAESRRWRRTTSGHYRAVTAQRGQPPTAPTTDRTAASVPEPPPSSPSSPPLLTPQPPSSAPSVGSRWLAVAAALVGLAVAGFFALRGEAHASAAELVSEWQVGARWVYRTSVDVPPDYPDENRAMSAFIERELVGTRSTKVGTELHFLSRGGDDDKRARKVLWRVHGDCIESLDPASRKTYERACLDADRSDDALHVFTSQPPSWEVRLKPGVGPTVLSWRNKKLGYTKVRDLKRADVAGKLWGDPNARPVTCDWRLSSEDTTATYRLADGLACSAVVVKQRHVQLRCRRGVSVPPLVRQAGRVKLFLDARGTEWLAVVGADAGRLVVDTCRIDSRAVHCQRHAGPAGSASWGVWAVSGGGQCRFRIAEPRDKKANRRRVATWALESAGLRRVGGTLPVTTVKR